ncbi:Fe2+-enterobactin ABC transporter substrate-binding protein [Aquabacterium sp. OR-4]|uniref:Fe2+-enterobactin ABC transporter substrate-binding protein n=1 Tax=Aquabacterium sp. OR-4 TaxID=2978127 RepID=UPI0028C7BC7E|nr:Fe2+-enterobactin ABC transporter substrate-binding protein [Aquabacterium sp. OR-4]MDT7839053.1 Fe2+-enterobactin ABC transporter substrate-binding protein [Aquabacterium sp. OR-4]
MIRRAGPLAPARRRLLGLACTSAASALGPVLSAPASAATPAPAGGSWPVVFRNPDGSEVRIAAPPQRILSTSVTLTGTLLAIDAPVVASSVNGDRRFFDQWAAVAKARRVQPLWSLNAVDIEAVLLAQPDLIVVSNSGADSARASVRELSQIAPTIVVDYAVNSWQAVARQLGLATGLQARAEQRVAEFSEKLRRVAQAIRVPEGLTTIVSYNGPGVINPVAMPKGSHGVLLAALGFRMESPDPRWHSGLDRPDDFVKAQYEQLSALQSRTVFLLRRAEDDTAALLNDRVLARLPAVQTRQVYGLGRNSFRIDYYSASEIVDAIHRRFAIDGAARPASAPTGRP